MHRARMMTILHMVIVGLFIGEHLQSMKFLIFVRYVVTP